jgi:SAM-dependent methyltransferase
MRFVRRMLSKLLWSLCNHWIDRKPEHERIEWCWSKFVRTADRDQRTRLYLDDLTSSFELEQRRRLYLDEIVKTIECDEQFLLPRFDTGFGRELDRFSTYQKDFVSFPINKGDKVLDIGAGAYPFPHATHLADLYEGETTHRTEPLTRSGLPFERCDIERLPYKDKEFDFVYCSHVLEHVRNPGRACQELMRIGRRGYIETPTRLSDIMLNFTRFKDHHRWHVNVLTNTLIFMEWCPRERRDMGINDFYFMLHSKYKNPFQDLVHNNRDVFVNMLLWEDSFVYYVFGREGTLLATNATVNGRLT